MITIGISTYQDRFQSLKKLVNSIRKDLNNDIIIAVNGMPDEQMNEQYRTELMKFCSQHHSVYLIMFPEMRALAKLWNEIIVHARTEFIYMLNDDVEFGNSDVINYITEKTAEEQLFLCPASSWSHFVISKSIAHDLGFFDERLLGIGEEDGDMEWRFINKFGYKVKQYEFPGIFNKGEYDNTNKKLDTHVNNKAKFNQQFIYNQKYFEDAGGIKGMFDYPMRASSLYGNIIQYPYEIFFQNNKHRLLK